MVKDPLRRPPTQILFKAKFGWLHLFPSKDQKWECIVKMCFSSNLDLLCVISAWKEPAWLFGEQNNFEHQVFNLEDAIRFHTQIGRCLWSFTKSRETGILTIISCSHLNKRIRFTVTFPLSLMHKAKMTSATTTTTHLSVIKRAPSISLRVFEHF